MISSILDKLNQKGIHLYLESGSLKYKAPKGALTDEHRLLISEKKQEIIFYLKNDEKTQAEGESVFPLIIDPDRRYEEFPLSDVQYAYWIGQQGGFDLGEVGIHAYLEYECKDLDCKRLEWAWNELIKRHDALRTIILPHGMQKVLEEVPYYQFKIINLSELDVSHQNKEIQKLRKTLSHESFSLEDWPFFSIVVCQLSSRVNKLAVSFSSLLIDSLSTQLLFYEWILLYNDPSAELPSLPFSFRDYLLSERSLRESVAYEESKGYWLSRLGGFPVGPGLPLRSYEQQSSPQRFGRIRRVISGRDWGRVKGKAKEYRLSGSGVLSSVFGEVLGSWSKEKHFAINLTLFNRWPVHEEIQRVVGDFTSIILLEVDYREGKKNFLERTRELQHRLWEDLEHRLFNGIEVLRELTRLRGDAKAILMPVVFTCVLGMEQGEEEESEGLVNPFEHEVYGISQTPQVWLDYRAYERGGDLVIEWDYVEGLFPDGLIELMHGSYCEAVERLGREEIAWEGEELVCLPSDQAEEREDYNKTDWAVGLGLLPSLLEAQVERQPDSVAVRSGRGEISY
ncbi:MAG: condensation domain-containing protein, partial [Gammaproteobacteria bacterium]|nr:condensation domain-containing protein [Gammaproteobacteria bacterium]